MTRRCQLLLLFVCALALGCRRDPYFEAYVETLNAEKRVLEDQIYELEYDYQKLCQELEACRKRESNSSSDDEPAASTAPKPRSRPVDSDSLRQPRSVRPKPREEPEEPLDLSPPKIETGTPVEPSPAAGSAVPSDEPAANAPEMNGPLMRPANSNPPAVEEPANPSPTSSAKPPSDAPASASYRPDQESKAPSAEVRTADAERRWVTQIVVNSARTRGADFDLKPGDDGIIVVFEPRNAVGDFVPLAGKVSLVLLDPAIAGDDARVARWDFDADEMGRGLMDDARAFQLKAPWTGPLPQHDALKLFLRYETIDGRKLEATHDLRLSLGGSAQPRWTPRPASRSVGELSRPSSVSEEPLPAPGRTPALNPAAAEELQTPPPEVHTPQDSVPAERPATAPPANTPRTTQRNRGFWKPYR